MAEMKISSSSSIKQLNLVLSQLFPAIDENTQRTVLLGVGNELQADDAAGLLVIRALTAQLGSSPVVLLLEGGIAPENFTGKIRKFAPARVIIVDAAEMGAAAGTVDWVSLDQIDGFSASSHILPLSVLAKFLIQDIGCQVDVIGIQAQTLEMGEDVSAPVQRAVMALAEALARQFIVIG
jgi:hydrogenase 3 maturation protease